MVAPRKEILAAGVEIYLGDCAEIMPTLGRVDACVTDPPYGINYVSNVRKATVKLSALQNDQEAPLWCVPLCEKLLSDTGAMYLFTRFDVAPVWMSAIKECGLTLKTPIVWDKTNHTAGDLAGDYGNQVELVLFAHRGTHKLRESRCGNLWRYARPVAGDHPTPKPPELMGRMIIHSTDLGDVVLDPFMGAGPTGVAAVELGRKFIGIEIEPKFFDMARRRIDAALQQPFLFVDKPERTS